MPTDEQREALRALPQVEELLHHEAMEALIGALPREMVVRMVRQALEDRRSAIIAGTASAPTRDELAFEVLRAALRLERPSLRRVVNASGVVIHTNLGRSPLAPAAVQAACEVAGGYSTLEYDCARMARGSRHDHYERIVCALTGAEAALALNNNAAAVMMVLGECAAGREAVISRGELVEIGGSFRVPDIMALSGARMVEVGTTNKTHLADYERAVSEQTGAFVKVHPSNFRMTGFTQDVPVKELRRLADAVNAHRAPADEVIVYEDLGSGALTDIEGAGYREKTVRETLLEGADLVSFSCDKLLGGPQAGIIVGRADLVERCKANPLARAMRLDKMCVAALEATLRLYLDDNLARSSVPTVRMLTESADDVLPRARALLAALQDAISPEDASLSLERGTSRAGGGALPMCDIDTHVVRVSFERGSAQGCERFLQDARDVPVIARINAESIVLDARTVLDGDEVEEIARAFAEYFAGLDD